MKIKHLNTLLTFGETEYFIKQVQLALKICREIEKERGKALFVGGIVRDLLMKKRDPGIHLKDIDIEVYGLNENQLMEILSKFGTPLTVGASFAVIKLNGLDFSMPRRDKKTGTGHKGFEITIDPQMSYPEAARRRSFTINSMGLDPLTGTIFDPFGGKRDLRKKILRIVDPQTFTEDSLRVLRGMQFVGRFGLKIDRDTAELCRSANLDDISPERIGEEWMKLLMLAKKPSVGLNAAIHLEIIQKLHPDIYAMVETKQEPAWHPEGGLWQHTINCVDEMAEIINRESLSNDTIEILMLAALLHDIGKPLTTEIIDGKIRSYNHHKAGKNPARDFMTQIKRNRKTINSVLPLIEEHLFLTFSPEPSEKAVRRLSVRLKPATIEMLCFLIEADMKAQKANKKRLEGIDILRNKAIGLKILDSMPKPLLTGNILMQKGYKQGKHLGEILDAAYQAQLNGDFTSERQALDWLNDNKGRFEQ
ncbi:MAG: CCA tRNA nucleotidyltransferase [Acidobacteria bacterium]|nr:CCA tRNA nucleotidyltransferase [Acidobacteriota bacterium]